MVVLALGFVPISLTIALLPEVKFQAGCNMILEISQDRLLLACRLGLFSRLSTIIADFLVVAVTWHRTFRGWKQLSKCKSLWTVSDCLLRDGAIYFVALLLVNAAQVLTHNPTFNPVSILTSALPLILVNRFMLNLRQVQPTRSFPSGSTVIPPFHPGAPDVDYGAFTSIIGNIGEPLVHAQNEEMDDGEGSAPPPSPLALSREESHA
ncbi:hypothetical protein PsYK624_067580 [Phanerochaete sordida]|uniref:Uncharacterized protein n=1 Tax=Phanerochaete sordida TaxID=48140 RepID=A0A9P3GA62_9APHY|nr:hypothetical protein PsYK624_067580 [Phanerochaete sordida]